ncbi:MAG: pyruvate dehydrogenase (acetyl-transferring) E1 component subunit alpha [Deltaproteobacteria bacterium]|nr:pyruvate dehydrogenase (acetyl-transferring) E1 component subunit alpha [Deltaproteobacteria bacterium]
MPRQKIDVPQSVEYLSILDAEGRLDKGLEPDIPEDLLLKLHRAMLLGRRFDERLLNLQRQGRIGTFAPISGQEASQLGAVSVLRPSDWMTPSFRETAAELWRGRTMESVMLAYGGYNEGGRAEEGSHTLPVSIPVGSQVLHAMGIAWAIKYRKKDDVAMAFLGDGGTSEGDFHEAMNFAGVFQVPLIIVCQNNHWAISVPRSKQTRARTLAQKALAYGIPGIQVDGNDILAVCTAAREAVDRARSGGGPTMIECVTYRLMMHTTADDPKRYRKDEEVEDWRKRDPLVRFQRYLTDKGLLSGEKIASIEEEIKTEIQEAVDRAEQLMKTHVDPLVMFDHAYAEMPPYLEGQKKELEEELALPKEDETHG